MLETLDSVLPAHKPGPSWLPTECEASLRANLSLEERKTAKDSAALPEDLSSSQHLHPVALPPLLIQGIQSLPLLAHGHLHTHGIYTHTPRKNNKISK